MANKSLDASGITQTHADNLSVMWLTAAASTQPLDFFMLSEASYELADLPAPLADLDLTPSGKWIAVTEPGNSQSLIFPNQTIALTEEIRFPKVRAIDDDTAVIVNSRAWKENNGQIVLHPGKHIPFMRVTLSKMCLRAMNSSSLLTLTKVL